ncbi:MAG: hypothetical protein EP329_24850 [Deltaproteobacteria bacterium]|nr:MAG: hypothetical protein EP329_24850 [Deltaproteobacteria bacterium]
MPQPHPTDEWQLWVDESGDFDAEHGDVVVAGLLVRADVAAVADRTLRRALQAAAPDCPWPLHATLTRRLSMYVLWPVHAATRRGTKLDPLTRDALSVLEHYAEKPLARALTALNKNREPSADVLDTLDLWLDEGAYSRALKERRATVRLAISRTLEAVGKSAGDDRIWSVAAAEAVVGDAYGQPLDDRYLSLLACALYRTRNILLQRPGHHIVRVLASERGVHPRRGAEREPLRQRHVAWASLAAAWSTDLTVTRGDASVELRPCRTYKYEDAPSPFVVADWLANACLYPCSTDWGIRDLTGRLRDRLALPCDVAGLATIAASGAAWSRERAAERGAPLAALTDGKRWSREQATAWAAALATERGR